jgi:PAS domain S-box-containing protein
MMPLNSKDKRRFIGERRYKAVFDNSLAAFFITKPDGTILEANRAANDLFGYSAEEFQKLGEHGIIDPESPQLQERLREKLEKGYTEGELIGKTKLGDRIWCDFSSVIFESETGEKMSSLLLIDKTDQNRLKFDLKERVKELKCLYDISQLEEQSLTIPELLHQAVSIIPKGFQRPEITSACIEWAGSKIATSNFKETPWQLVATSRRFTDPPLVVTISYLYEFSPVSSGPFLENEKVLLEAVKDQLSIKVEKILQRDELHISLKEKEILLSEVHHRVKNNLALISSLMQIQAMNTANPEVSSQLLNNVLKIKSMAGIHEQLYQAGSFSRLKFSEGMKSLIENIVQTLKYDTDIQLNFDLEDVELNINQAMPCSLLINEVLTNILKYSFEDKQRGMIATTLQTEEDTVKVIIKDDGKGLPAKFEELDGQFPEMQLVELLTEQLGGEKKLHSSNSGTLFELTFSKYEGKGSASGFVY